MAEHTPFAGSAVAPLIMTALLDRQSFMTLDGLRARHFPAALNHIQAHVTLFHHLPGEALRAIVERLAGLAARTAPFPFTIETTRFLGRGVAFDISCPALAALRNDLAATWRDRLTAQDRQGYRPHATIQNKVTTEQARDTQVRLAALLPLAGTVEGLALWHYRGGPWDEAGRFAFAGGSLRA